MGNCHDSLIFKTPSPTSPELHPTEFQRIYKHVQPPSHIQYTLDPYLSYIQHRWTRELYILKKIVLSSEKEADLFISNLSTIMLLDHDYLLKVHHYMVDRSKPNGGDTSFTIHIVLEHFQHTLQDELELRTQIRNSFRGTDLLKIMNGLVDALEFLQLKSVCHGDLQASKVYITSKKQAKLMVLGNFTPSYEFAIDSQTSYYLENSPPGKIANQSISRKETMASLTSIVLPSGGSVGSFKSDVYFLGQIVVSMMALSYLGDSNGRNGKGFSQMDIVREYSKRFRPFLESVVEAMLEESEEKRPDFLELKRMLLYEEYFSTVPNSIPESMRKRRQEKVVEIDFVERPSIMKTIEVSLEKETDVEIKKTRYVDAEREFFSFLDEEVERSEGVVGKKVSFDMREEQNKEVDKVEKIVVGDVRKEEDEIKEEECEEDEKTEENEEEEEEEEEDEEYEEYTEEEEVEEEEEEQKQDEKRQEEKEEIIIQGYLEGEIAIGKNEDTGKGHYEFDEEEEDTELEDEEGEIIESSGGLLGVYRKNFSTINKLVVTLDDDELNKETAVMLGEVIGRQTQLGGLELTLQNINNKGDIFEPISRGIKLIKHLSSCYLNLRKSSLTDNQLESLLNSLIKHKNLLDVILNVADNDITNEGCMKIAEWLRSTRSIKSLALNFGGNKLGNEGITSITRELRKMEGLESLTLYLYNNAIQQCEGIFALMKCLQMIKGLKKVNINLSGNLLWDDDLEIILKFINEVKGDEIVFDISDNKISEDWKTKAKAVCSTRPNVIIRL